MKHDSKITKKHRFDKSYPLKCCCRSIQLEIVLKKLQNNDRKKNLTLPGEMFTKIWLGDLRFSKFSPKEILSFGQRVVIQKKRPKGPPGF